MMGEYVKRSDALQAVGDIHPLDYNGQGIVERIKAIPAADVVEVRHGRWVYAGFLGQFPVYKCSLCGNMARDYRAVLLHCVNYCPSCGAKMDGGQDE